MTASEFTLVFQKNRHSGMPELAEQQNRIPSRQLAGWQGWLRKEYERLRRGNDFTVTFPTAAGNLPRTWQVTRRRDDPRMPTLILHPADPESGAGPDHPRSEPQRLEQRPAKRGAVEAATAGWRQEMLSELEELFDRVPLDRGQRPAVAYVLEELQQAVADAPGEMLLVLFAGYLHACGRMCRLRGREEQSAYYIITGQVLGELCEAMLPTDLLRGIGSSSGAGSPQSRSDPLMWVSRLLAHVIGLRNGDG